ncbi:MAG TPA: hypothetical protein VIT65_27340 [Microlunatus sp.]
MARQLLLDAIPRWVTDRGFSFQAPDPITGGLDATTPGLQGTEMWLSVVWLLADLLGLSAQLGYHPRGIHRPEAAERLPPSRNGHRIR